MTETEKLARMFKVLSVETRVRMIRSLSSRPLCVNALARQLGITPAAVSQHLRVLRDAGVVSGVKQGFFVHYRLNKETLARWKKLAGDLLGDE
jgi:DNA-binding transcriptional ArsR family regulator